jgi:hypothetical protein
MGQFGEHGFKVEIELDALGLCRFEERVEIGAGLGATDGVSEEPVAPPDDERTDSVLADVVVDRALAVVEEANQFGLFSGEVMKRLAEQTIRQHRVQMHLGKGWDAIERRAAVLGPIAMTLLDVHETGSTNPAQQILFQR